MNNFDFPILGYQNISIDYLIALIISGNLHAIIIIRIINAAVHMVLRNSLGVKLIASICTPRNLNVNRLSLAMLFKRSLNNKAHKEYESLRAFFLP